jgi:hypothetical protein
MIAHSTRDFLCRHLIAKAQSIHLCPDHCMAFYGANAWRSFCNKCGEPRYRADSKTPLAQFYYFPLETRIRNLYSNETMSRLVRYPVDRHVDPEVISDVMDGKLWKGIYEPLFGPRYEHDLAFSLCLDGVQNSTTSAKEMFAVCLQVLNLPPEVRTRRAAMWLSILIPSPSVSASDFDIFCGTNDSSCSVLTFHSR